MGQDLLNPPSVEGWHTGTEWINSGSLMRRVNFAADLLGDAQRPGVQAIIRRLQDPGNASPAGFVDTCLDLMGPLEVSDDTRQELVDHAETGGSLGWMHRGGVRLLHPAGHRDAPADRLPARLPLRIASLPIVCRPDSRQVPVHPVGGGSSPTRSAGPRVDLITGWAK